MDYSYRENHVKKRLYATDEMTENNNLEKGCWTKFSESRLIDLEKQILQVLKSTYKGWFVPIGSTVGTDDKIWTVSLNEDSDKTPLVMLHGFAAGVGFWCLNLDAVAKDRAVYAVDLLGFGRSSRPNFNSDHVEAEQQMVQSLEEWRKKMNLDKIILLGHSFGGYLATSYTITHPERVKHLILVDPWGFTEKPATFNPAWWIKAIAYPLQMFNPLATVRAAGPMGPWLVRKVRSDISEKYSGQVLDKEVISEYIYQCNSRKPTGETAFHSMIKDFAFAKTPMIHRVDDLRIDIPITIIYGSDSWVDRDRSSARTIQEKRPNSYVRVEIVKDAGHHIHADQPHMFNEIVISACQHADGSVVISETEIEIIEEKDEDKVKISMSKVFNGNENDPLDDMKVSNELFKKSL